MFRLLHLVLQDIKAQVSTGCEYGASDYSKEEDQKDQRHQLNARNGARQNIVRGTRVSGKDVNEEFWFHCMLESYQEKGLGYINEMNEDVEYFR